MRTARSLPYGGGDLCPGGLCPEGSLSKGDSVRQEVTSYRCEQYDWQTGVITLPSRNFFCRQKGSYSNHCCVLADIPLALTVDSWSPNLTYRPHSLAWTNHLSSRSLFQKEMKILNVQSAILFINFVFWSVPPSCHQSHLKVVTTGPARPTTMQSAKMINLFLSNWYHH